MAGLGSQAKLGIRKETTPGTGVVPSQTIPFTSEGFSAPRTLIQSETIGGDGMVDKTVAGDTESSGSITQEFDAESSGHLLWFATGDNGYTAGGAFTDGQITSAPGATATGTGASIAAGDYYYTVAAVWTHDFLGENFIMPDSAASTQTTVTSGQQVDLTWTNPTGLTLADHTYAGTAIYRSTTDGASSTVYFVHYQSGTGASWSDTGADTYADTAVAPVTNTTLYDHTLVGAAAASGLDRLDYFSVQISKNVTDDERFLKNKINDISLSVGGRGDIVQLTANIQGDTNESVSGEFGASAPTIKLPILGRNVRVAINGSKDCDIQAIDWNLNNNLERQPTFCSVTLAEGNRNVSGSWTQVFDDRTNYNLAVNASEVTLGIYMRGEPLDTSGSTLNSSDHSVAAIPFPRLAKFYCEKVLIGEFTNPVESAGQIIANATWSAAKGATSSTDCTITLINTVSVYDGS